MTVSASKPITLDEFLKLPETKPASEFVNLNPVQGRRATR
jgi:hypothetical protein